MGPLLVALPQLSVQCAIGILVGTSVTRLADLLDFRQLFKAFGNN